MELKQNAAVMDCYQEVYSGTARQEETQTAVVPEALPDIGSILCATGTALIRGKDVEAGRVRIEANVPVCVSYCPEEGSGVHGLEVNVPLYLSLEDEGIPGGGECVVALALSAVEAKMLNPRKISVRAEAVFTVDCYAPGRMETGAAPEITAGEGINVLERSLVVTPVRSVTEKTFVLVDEFSIPASMPEAAVVLNQQTAVRVEDAQATGAKLVVRGSVKSCVFYADRDCGVGTVEFSSAFSQIIDLERAPEDEIFTAVSVLLSGAHYDLAEDGHGGSAELHLVAQAVVREKAEVTCLADAYCNRRALALTRREREFTRVTSEPVFRETLRETLPTETPVGSVLQGCAALGAPRTEAGGVTVPVTVCLLYRGEDGAPCAAKREFRASFSGKTGEGEALLPTAAGVQELYLTPAEHGADMRLTLELRSLLTETESVSCVEGIGWDETAEESAESAPRPTLVILRASAADDLWAIAKANCSTVEAIRAANALGDENGNWEKLILIPKTV